MEQIETQTIGENQLIDFSALRDLFPVTKKWAYLDHAATGSLADPVFRAVAAHLEDFSQNGCANFPDWEETIDATRVRCATLVGAAPEEIAITKSTSDGAIILARGLAFDRDDNIVIPDREFPANYCPWKDLEQDGVHCRIVPLKDGRLLIDDLLAAVDGRTRLVALSSVAYHNGFRVDLKALGEALHARGVPLYVDAIQSLGAMRIDVEDCRISFLSADSHKWLLGMEGVGFFYCRQAMLDAIRPPFVSWRSMKEPFDLHATELELAPTARRFEYAAYNLAGIFGFNAALELLLGIGIEQIQERVLALTDRLVALLNKRGFEILSPRSEGEASGIVTFRYLDRKVDYPALAKDLKRKGVVLSARGGGLRAAPHFYNNEEDLEKLMEALP